MLLLDYAGLDPLVDHEAAAAVKLARVQTKVAIPGVT
jgi:hypothetical protein